MPDLMSRIREANRALEVPVDVDRVRAGVERKRRIRRRNRNLAGATLAATAVALVFLVILPARDRAVDEPIARNSQPVASPESGIQTRFLTDDAQVETVVDDPQRAVLSLLRGAARFEVDPARRRTVTVRARFVSVEVVGTIFEVRHVAADAVRVLVERGKVRVTWPGGTTALSAGEERTFEVEASAPPTPSATAIDAPSHAADWRDLANKGNTHAAYAALQAAGPTAVRDEPGDLFLAADVARRSGHPSEAIAPLRKLVARYPGDGRAPSAAFTLGLLELSDSPAMAAESFATCRRLQPGGPLVHDALAREVEAQSRAGNAAAARALAQQYVEHYPNGNRITAVKRFGGIE